MILLRLKWILAESAFIHRDMAQAKAFPALAHIVFVLICDFCVLSQNESSLRKETTLTYY
jgi:hypothetical protein